MLDSEFQQRIYSTLTSVPATSPADQPLVERLLALIPEKDRIVVQIASEGLTLADKLTVEKTVLSSLKSEIPDKTFSVYFKKASSSTSTPLPRKFQARTKTRPIPGVRKIIAVASGKGGVGKSTVSCTLAAALVAKGLRVGLLDADVSGPSAPMLLGANVQPQLNAAGRLEPVFGQGVKVMSFGFFSDHLNPVLWRGPMVAKAIEQFCFDIEWGDLDYLIIDCPPGTSDVQLTLAENLAIDAGLIVSTPQDVALIDAHKALSMFLKYGIRILGLVENMSVYVCPSCGHEEAIFGEGAEAMLQSRGIKRIARIPLAADVRLRADRGESIVASKHGAVFLDLAEQLISARVLDAPNSSRTEGGMR